jgi:hypothetical protein
MVTKTLNWFGKDQNGWQGAGSDRHQAGCGAIEEGIVEIASRPD